MTALTAAERTKRARKAADASVRSRRRNVKERDALLWLAYCWLEQEPLTLEDACKAIAFLSDEPAVPEKSKWLTNPQGVNKPTRECSPYAFLARATGLTKQAAWAIIQKYRNAQLTHKNRE